MPRVSGASGVTSLSLPIDVLRPFAAVALTVPSAAMLTCVSGGTWIGPPSPRTVRPEVVIRLPSALTSSEPPRV